MWTSTIIYTVFTRIKAEVKKKLGNKYADINFTTSNTMLVDPKFPNVYVRKLQGAEMGQTLDGLSVNAVQSNIQIEVTDNESELRAQEVADEVCMVMKSMRYQMVGEPYPDNSQGVYRIVARFSRVVGYNDII